MRWIAIVTALMLASTPLAGCAYSHRVVYDNLTDIEGLATVQTDVSTPIGLNSHNERVFLVPHNGSNLDGTWKDTQKSTKISESTASSPGPMGQILQNGASASGASQAAVAGAVVDAIK